MADGVAFDLEVEGFRRWTETLLDGLERDAQSKVLKAMAFEFIKRVVQKTPVDTGRARGGWMSYLLANGQPSNGGGSDPKAIAEGVAAGSFTQKLNGTQQFIVLVNAVDYIVILEFGSSGQAPAGMMRLTFRELQAGDTMTDEMRKALEAEIIATNRKHPAQPVSA